MPPSSWQRPVDLLARRRLRCRPGAPRSRTPSGTTSEPAQPVQRSGSSPDRPRHAGTATGPSGADRWALPPPRRAVAALRVARAVRPPGPSGGRRRAAPSIRARAAAALADPESMTSPWSTCATLTSSSSWGSHSAISPARAGPRRNWPRERAARGAQGMIVPSAAPGPGHWNLVVFPAGLSRVAAPSSRAMTRDRPADRSAPQPPRNRRLISSG